MSVLFIVALLGGAASVLTPCVLPLLPAILAVSGGEGRRRVWGIVLGIELSFFILAILLAGAISSLGLPPDILRYVAAVLLALFGIVLVVPKLHDAFTNAVSKATARLPQRHATGTGFTAGFLSGLPLGLVWAPCAGPILAGITVAASSSRFSGRTVLTMVAYAIGMVGPLAAVIFGGQKLSTRLRKALGGGRRVLVPTGLVLLATAALIGFGGLNKLNDLIARNINLTSTPTATLEKRALHRPTKAEAKQMKLTVDELRSNGYPELAGLKDLGPAPAIAGISRWYNSKPLTIKALRGKVVLVDFWTYSCINCIRTLPYVRMWYAKYAKDGLVVLGVHTPEFAFEKDPTNVGNAVKDFHVRYPVALDPVMATWNNYYNAYWPAHYLIDRNGHIRSVHYGEGAYRETENAIRELLGMKAGASGKDQDNIKTLTPETYLGYARAMRFDGTTAGTSGFADDHAASYAAPSSLDADRWAYEGRWTVGGEYATAGPAARIDLHYRAQNVFIVAGGHGTINDVRVNSYKLYTVRSGKYNDGTLRLDISPGIRVYSFTFG